MNFPKLYLTYLVPILIILTGCEKGKENVPKSSIEVLEIKTISITQTGRKFKCTGFIAGNGGWPITSKGICWSTSPNPNINDGSNFNDVDSNLFTVNLVGLQPGIKYYVRAYAANQAGITYGNELSLTTENSLSLVIGDSFKGGVIAYILKEGDSGYMNGETHGIIAAPFDQSDGVVWGGDIYDYLGAGKLNTLNSVNGKQNDTSKSAARICHDLILNGFDDWYLPCRYEFKLIANNREAIGNFSNGLYWSSTSVDNSWAEPNGPYIFRFENEKVTCVQYPATRYNVKLRVRAIRLF